MILQEDFIIHSTEEGTAKHPHLPSLVVTVFKAIKQVEQTHLRRTEPDRLPYQSSSQGN